MLYPKKVRFTKEEVEVRKLWAKSEFLTLYPIYIAFYKGGGRGSEKALPCGPAR